MEKQVIQNKIYTIRGQRVMLDRDLAEMYGVETKRLNEQIKRNIKRFPDDFMFQLKKEEFEILKSQFATSSWGGTRKLPYAFTELGVAMLSSVLNSDTAIEINMGIMRAFVTIRQALTNPQPDRYEELKQYMDEILIDQNDINEDTRIQLELINRTLAELQTDKRLSDKPRRRFGFHRED
ncbi:ORF6N domain-containing protein [Paludibacter sp.]|uniref:ORF6N domain-containing protein n=1 Tax=Paludibacter sp. TaxID=1898105 RepID=UPI001355C8DA|nr:ORF6N domain-containing protein [Paludibacter sp.]MTK52290.1 ORF6N domain-containing protein [Paludibacter sp.]